MVFIQECLELRHCTLVSEELSGSNGNFWVQLLPLRSGPARHLPIVGGQLAASTCRGLLTLGGLGPDPPSTGGRRELLQLPKTTCAICTVVKDKYDQFTILFRSYYLTRFRTLLLSEKMNARKSNESYEKELFQLETAESTCSMSMQNHFCGLMIFKRRILFLTFKLKSSIHSLITVQVWQVAESTVISGMAPTMQSAGVKSPQIRSFASSSSSSSTLLALLLLLPITF